MNKDLKNKIIELRKEGRSYNEISKILQCSKSVISYHCSKIENNEELVSINVITKNIEQTKTPFTDFGEKFNNESIDEIVRLKYKGLTYDEIKNKTGVSFDKIKKICRKYSINDANVYAKKTNKPNNQEIKKVQEYYDNCLSTRKTASEFNWSRHRVSKYIKIKKIVKQDNETRKKSIVKAVINWRRRVKIKLIEYKGGECEKCGYNKCINALSFHHKDPNEKDFSISGKSYSFDRMKKEVDKCILVCSNCHIEIHEGLNQKH
jgi:DNA invertase Pin-like site-specific DNA recombinase